MSRTDTGGARHQQAFERRRAAGSPAPPPGLEAPPPLAAPVTRQDLQHLEKRLSKKILMYFLLLASASGIVRFVGAYLLNTYLT